ncbi:tetratricopeptide repeat protein [Cognataquiflexum rubidum]|uniref:tetratricopeptide repeat protein n=1 Tax=Cognataquiflexum rubidum TaxID=2922273 RepID=UPI001F13057F|nr:tetratricopeptide repeat protein [Cognataquiflexum rubidum]MCH6236130.1 tetratricopeptide repeat protein [Cognataquiflexum rubidum]
MRYILLLWLAVFSFQAMAQYEDLDIKMEEAMNLSEAGEHLEAYAILSDIIQSKTYFAEAYFFRGIVRDRAGDKTGALTDYNILLELDPLHTEGVFARGILRYQLQQYDLAVEDLTSLLHLSKRETTTILYQKPVFQSGITGILTQQSVAKDYIYQYLGLAYPGMGEFEKSNEFFDKAIELRPWNPDYFLNRGRSHQKNGELEKAKADYVIALKLNPNHPLTNQYLAEIAIALGDVAGADLYFSSAISGEPEFASSYKQRGYHRLKASKWEEALGDFEKALETDQDDIETMLYKAYVLEKLGLVDKSLAEYENVIALDPLESSAHFEKGNIHYKTKMYDLAMASYLLAIHHRPDFTEAYYQKGLTHHQQKNDVDACKDLKTAYDLGLKMAEEALKKICK